MREHFKCGDMPLISLEQDWNIFQSICTCHCKCYFRENCPLHSIKDVTFIVQKQLSNSRWKFLYYVIKVRNISSKLEAIVIHLYLLSFVV